MNSFQRLENNIHHIIIFPHLRSHHDLIMSEMSVSLTTLSVPPVPQCIRLLNFGRSRCRKWGFIKCCHYSYTLLSTVSHNHITLLQIVKKCSRGRSNLFEVTNPWSNYWLRLLWCFLWLAWFMIILIILVQSHQCGMITCETKLCLNTGEKRYYFSKYAIFYMAEEEF